MVDSAYFHTAVRILFTVHLLQTQGYRDLFHCHLRPSVPDLRGIISFFKVRPFWRTTYCWGFVSWFFPKLQRIFPVFEANVASFCFMNRLQV